MSMMAGNEENNTQGSNPAALQQLPPSSGHQGMPAGQHPPSGPQMQANLGQHPHPGMMQQHQHYAQQQPMHMNQPQGIPQQPPHSGQGYPPDNINMLQRVSQSCG